MLKALSKIVAGTLILLSGGMVFLGGGANLMNLRDYDATIGLIERPLKTFSQFSKLFQPIEAEAQQGVFCVNCVNEASFNVEKILNKLLRDLVLSFVKGLLDLLKNLFNQLLSLVEDWANTVLGIRLNLSHIRRFVALQAYKLYNQLEGEVNQLFDNILGPVAESIGSLASEAAATVELAHADRAACVAVPDQCSKTPSASPTQLANDFKQGLTGVLQESCRALLLEPQKNTPKNALEDSVWVAYEVFNGQCPNINGAVAETMGELNSRTQKIEDSVEKATEPENIKKGDSNSCAPIIRSDENVQNARGVFNPNGNLSIDTSVSFTNSVVQEASNAVSGKVVIGLTESECDLANTAKQNANALDQVNNSKNVPQSESLVDAVLATITDFFNEIFKKLQEVIVQVINSALSSIGDLINKIGIREISGPLGRVFGNFKSTVTSSVKDLLNQAREQVAGSIR